MVKNVLPPIQGFTDRALVYIGIASLDISYIYITYLQAFKSVLKYKNTIIKGGRVVWTVVIVKVEVHIAMDIDLDYIFQVFIGVPFLNK